jgi:hypothetical protein
VITGALILAAGTALGWLLRSLPARRRDPKPVEAVCGCGHHHSMHDPQTGACNASVQVSRYSQSGSWTGYEYAPCACLRYSGPLPYPEFYAPSIALEGE